MSDEERLTKEEFEEFAEKYMEENSYLCHCSSTPVPPCAFCEGDFIDDEYEGYLEALEESE